MSISNNTNTIQNRISNVKNSLDKLTNIIVNDHKLYHHTVKAMLDCHVSSLSSSQSSEVNFQSNQGDSNNLATLHNPNPNTLSQQSNFSTQIHTKCENTQTKPIDLTIKKVKPQKNIKKKDESQISNNKPYSKLKNVKSQKKFNKKKMYEQCHPKTINTKKNVLQFVKPLKEKQREKSKLRPDSKNTATIKVNKSGTNLKNDMLTSVSQSRGLQLKYHLNLKKQVCMKINDLKIKKVLCQIQQQYLSAALKVTKQEVKKLGIFTKKFNDESYIKMFALKSIIRFFSQFSQDIESDDQLEDKLISILQNPNKLIKLTMKLPDILHHKSILSQQKCRSLSQQYNFLEEKSKKINFKQNNFNIFFMFITELHNYISFLVDNDMVHQTKRKNIFTVDMKEFFSDRSTKDKKHKNASLIPHRQRTKQYDTERRHQENTMKRTNTSKLFSPKIKKLKKQK